MSVADDLKGTWKSPRGKTLIMAAAGGLVALWWFKGRQAADATATDPTTLTTQDRIPAATGGGGSGGSSTTTADDARPKDNATWLAKGVSALSNPPYNYDAISVFNALTLYLTGLQVTTTQQAIVSAAIQLLGSPPEGAPPLNTSPPTTTTTPPPSTTTTPPPATTHTSPAFTLSVFPGGKVEDFNRAVRARTGFFVDWAVITAANPGIETNINWGPSGSKDLEARTWKHNATYYVPSMTR